VTSTAVEFICVRGVWSYSGIASPVAQMGGICVRKGKGYNRVHAVDAMPSQNGL